MQLATNYRSTQTIVRAAHAVIEHNSERQPIHLQATGDVGQPLRLYTTEQSSEGIAVVRQISRMVGGADMIQADQHAERSANTRSFGEFGVLVRTGQQPRGSNRLFAGGVALSSDGPHEFPCRPRCPSGPGVWSLCPAAY